MQFTRTHIAINSVGGGTTQSLRMQSLFNAADAIMIQKFNQIFEFKVTF